MKLSRAVVRLHRELHSRARRNGPRAAVSLHGHSECSRENLQFLPGIARRIPLVATLFERSLVRYERAHHRPLDFSEAYWRPPLAPAEVVASEREQIQRRFECEALVSLTDHDTLEGPRALRANGNLDTPLSVEWSVPIGQAVFHLGVHNISPRFADDVERALAAYTSGASGDLAALLDWLCESPTTFIVLNHPYWDLGGIGPLLHESALLAFLRAHRSRIHALELNGYRTWAENRRVLPLAEGFNLPIVGGGDRHGDVPNTIVNLTEATCFAGFAEELRAGRATSCVVLPEYEQPFNARVLQTAAGVLKNRPDHHGGRCKWSDRVFITVDGVERSLESMWTGVSWWLHGAVATTRLLGSRAFSPMFDVTRADGLHMLDADCTWDPIVDASTLLQTPPSTAAV